MENAVIRLAMKSLKLIEEMYEESLQIMETGNKENSRQN